MRTFHLIRNEDVSGVSGVGVVAEGVVFSDGVTVLRWKTMQGSTAIYSSVEHLLAIHGHGGATVVEFTDEVTS